MKRFFLYRAASLLTLLFLLRIANAKSSCQKYFSPNHKLHAVIQSVLEPGEIIPESVVSIYDSSSKLLQQKSYISPDHEHGYNVAQLKWSADSKFCVWSLTSSGGHSPWHFPTDCYIQKCHQIINIDTQLNCGLTQAKFKLQLPHTLLSQRLIPNPEGEPKYAKLTIDLEKLKCR